MGKILKKGSAEYQQAIASGAEIDAPPEAQPVEPQSIAETALHSGMQGVSVGTFDEVQGLLGGAFEAGGVLKEKLGLSEPHEYLGDPLDPEDAPPSALERVLAAYKQSRNAERRDVHQGELDNPKTALGAEMVGSLLAPGPKGTKGLKGLARVGEGIKTGAKLGAAYGLGKSEAEDAKGLALDTLKGGAIGAGTGAVIGGVSAAAQPALKRMADRRAYKALDPYMKSLQPLMDKSPAGDRMREADALGRKALDNKILRFGDNSANIDRRAAAELADTGPMMEANLGRIQDETARLSRGPGFPTGKPVSRAEVVQKLLNDADDALRNGDADLADALRAESDKIIRGIGARADDAMTLPESEAFKRTLQDRVNYDKTRTMTQPTIDAKTAAAAHARRGTEEAVESLAGPDELAQFNALKKRYGDLAKLSDTAGYGSGRLARNNWLSLGDTQAAQAFGKEGSILPPWAAALANKLGRERGSASAATLAEALQKGGTANLPIGGLTGLSADVSAQSLTPEEEQRRRYLRLLAGD